MKTTFLLLLTFCFLHFTAGWAQLVNTGKAYLGEGTLYSAHADFINTEKGEFYNDGEAYFYEHFTNDGLFDFTFPQAEVVFSGTETQFLNGKAPVYFNILTLDHQYTSEAFSLENEFYIEKEVRFYRGILNSRNPLARLFFGETAIANNPSDQSHIDGPVVKIGSSDFAYPIGNRGFYQPLLTESLQNPQVYTATYFYENSNFDYPHDQRSNDIGSIDNREFWEVTEAGDEQVSRMLSLSYSTATTPPNFIRAAEEDRLIIVYWNPDAQRWESKGGAIDLQNRLVSALVEENGIFTLGLMEQTPEDCEPEVFNLVDTYGASDNKYMRVVSNCAEITQLSVFNRWGVKVFETRNYGLQGDVFDGISSGRLTLNRGEFLPTGTYFYIMEYRFDTGEEQGRRQKNGYVYVKSN